MLKRLSDAIDYLSSLINYRTRNQEDPESLISEDDDISPRIEELDHGSTAECEEPSISNIDILKSYASIVLTRENLPYVAASSLLTSLSIGLNFISPWLLMKTVESFNQDNSTDDEDAMSQNALICLMVGAYAFSQMVPILRDQVMAKITTNSTATIIKKSMNHLLNKDLDYHVKTPFSDLVYLLQKAFSVSMAGNPLLTKIVPTLVETSVASAALTQLYGIEMGAGLLMMLTVFSIYSAGTAYPVIDAKEEMLTKGNEVWEVLTESLRLYQPMREFCKFDYTTNKVAQAIDEMKVLDFKNMNLPSTISQGHIVITRAAMLLGLLYIQNSKTDEEFTVNDFVLLVGYLNQLCGLLPNFGTSLNQVFVAWPDLKFVFNELVKENDVAKEVVIEDILIDEETIGFPNHTPPEICIENISFAYQAKSKDEPSKPIFKELSFRVEPGQKVALVSESGAGKTTLFNLMYGYYKPHSGSIKINGQDISKINPSLLEKQITIFNQRPNLFNATVRDNILYGAPNSNSISDEDIFSLAATVNLETFLTELTHGLDTKVGEGGKAISGGQQQKVAILRGLMKQTNLILLDEVTASLDSQSAKDITRAMEDISEGKTTIIITHKLSEVVQLDSIIVIDKGRAIAHGTHKELLQYCELYQKLWHNYTSAENESTAKMIQRLGENMGDEAISSYCDSNAGPSKVKEDEDSDDQLTEISEIEEDAPCTVTPRATAI